MGSQSFIFCVGAAKSGTSWLFDYLYHHPQCHFSPVKEMHYWDSLEGGAGGFFRERSFERLDWLKGRRAVVKDPEVNAYQDRAMADIRAWLDLFDGKTRDDDAYLDFLGRGRADARVIGDFTPSYAALSEESFANMAGLTDDVRFIFLMRDPVERIWSHVRMDAGDEAGALAKFDDWLAGGEKTLAVRSNYRRTLNRLNAVVPEGRLHLEYYERLFTDAAVERLCAFLGIDKVPANFSKEINVSQKAMLDAARRARAREALRPQYNFVRKIMGGLPAEWTADRVTA